MDKAAEYYQFVIDESQIRQFYRILIEPFKTEDYLDFIIIPIARRKYWDGLSKSQTNLSTRPISTQAGEDSFVDELLRYEVKVGLYKDNNTFIPGSAIAMYVTANPMHELRAYFALQKEMSDKISAQLLTSTTEKIGKISTIYKSCLHKSDLKIFMKLDVDTKDETEINKLKSLFNDNDIKPHIVIESRGGYHVLLRRDTLGRHHNTLFQFIEQNKNWVSIEKNALVIIPGTLQGGFPAKIVQWTY